VRQLLREHADFRRLFVAAVISMAGDWFAFVALAELVTKLTGRPGAPAFVFAGTVLPMFFASPIAGWAADRFDRKTLLVLADAVRVPLALLLCVAAAVGSTMIAMTAVVLLGVAAAFHDPITSAVVPNLVPPRDLARAQALLGAVWGAMLFVGAGLGGIVAELFGTQTAFVVNAASFGISALLLAAIRKPMQESSAEERRQSSHGGLRDVLKFIVRDRLVRRLVLAKIGVSSANGTVGLLPAIATVQFPTIRLATGFLFAARGLGAMLGPMLARWIGGAAPAARTVIWMCGAATVLYVSVYSVIPLVPIFGLALVLVIVAHLGGGAQWAMSTYGLQVATPDSLRGRVLSLDYGLATLAIGISAVIAGVLADASNATRATWWLCGAGAIYGIGWVIWALALPRPRT
jgi:predicted MFS family arabinose efflux permease